MISYEQSFVDDLFSPSLIDGAALSSEKIPLSPDFILTDSFIDDLFPLCPSKNIEEEFICAPTKNDFSEHQEYQEGIPSDLDLSNIDLENITDYLTADPLNDQSIDIGKYISESSFLSPIDSSEYSPSSIDGSSSDDSTMMANDRTLPPSPSTSSMTTKRSKLNPLERKLRKKTQNKTAAEKYRLRKKSERNQLLDRHTQVKNLNQKLKAEFENLAYQIQQLKQLLVDVVQVPLPCSK